MKVKQMTVEGKKERGWVGLTVKKIIKEPEEKDTQDTQKQVFTSPRTLNSFSKKEERVNGVFPVSSVSNPEVYKNRFCWSDCGNYDTPECPMKVHKIPKDTPMPLKCYGWKAPLPSEEAFSVE